MYAPAAHAGSLPPIATACEDIGAAADSQPAPAADQLPAATVSAGGGAKKSRAAAAAVAAALHNPDSLLSRVLDAEETAAGGWLQAADTSRAPPRRAAPAATTCFLTQACPGRPALPAAAAAVRKLPASTLETAASLLKDLPTPLVPLVIAKSTTRRGKGGRQPAADPRLDPNMDPKRAMRILKNRLSAARSKLKQKLLNEVRRCSNSTL